MTDLRKLNIDGVEHEVPANYTLMQACEEFGGAEIPRFCYHERLSVCLLYTSPSPRDRTRSRMPSSA